MKHRVIVIIAIWLGLVSQGCCVKKRLFFGDSSSESSESSNSTETDDWMNSLLSIFGPFSTTSKRPAVLGTKIPVTTTTSRPPIIKCSDKPTDPCPTDCLTDSAIIHGFCCNCKNPTDSKVKPSYLCPASTACPNNTAKLCDLFARLMSCCCKDAFTPKPSTQRPSRPVLPTKPSATQTSQKPLSTYPRPTFPSRPSSATSPTASTDPWPTPPPKPSSTTTPTSTPLLPNSTPTSSTSPSQSSSTTPPSTSTPLLPSSTPSSTSTKPSEASPLPSPPTVPTTTSQKPSPDPPPTTSTTSAPSSEPLPTLPTTTPGPSSGKSEQHHIIVDIDSAPVEDEVVDLPFQPIDESVSV